MRLYTLSLLGVSLITLAMPASGQSNGFGEGEGFTAGIGVIANWSPYDGADSPSTTPVPYLAYDWENAHLGVDGFRYQFWNTETLTVTAAIQPRWSFGDPEDSPLFADVKRDTALEAGLAAKLDLGNFYVSGGVLHDVSGVHKGLEASFETGLEVEAGPFKLDMRAGYAYRDSDLSQHLYGVNSSEARAGLPAYSADASWQPYVGIEALYPISEKMTVFAFGQYQPLNSEAKNSPLVSRDRNATLGLAVLKRF